MVLLQTSLILYASAEDNTTSPTNATTVTVSNVTSMDNQTMNATLALNNTSNASKWPLEEQCYNYLIIKKLKYLNKILANITITQQALIGCYFI